MGGLGDGGAEGAVVDRGGGLGEAAGTLGLHHGVHGLSPWRLRDGAQLRGPAPGIGADGLRPLLPSLERVLGDRGLGGAEDEPSDFLVGGGPPMAGAEGGDGLLDLG